MRDNASEDAISHLPITLAWSCAIRDPDSSSEIFWLDASSEHAGFEIENSFILQWRHKVLAGKCEHSGMSG
jgi:hypothetical protein